MALSLSRLAELDAFLVGLNTAAAEVILPLFRAELPREESGKIFKRKLRDPYWRQAGRNV